MARIILITNPLTPVNSGFHAVIIARGYIGLSSTCRSQIFISMHEKKYQWYAVTGTFHGSQIWAYSEGSARRTFHRYYNGESIICDPITIKNPYLY